MCSTSQEDWSKEALGYFCSEVMDKVMMLNVEYKNLGQVRLSVCVHYVCVCVCVCV